MAGIQRQDYVSRAHRVQVFTPKSLEEVNAVRKWLDREEIIEGFDEAKGSWLWLGYVMPRHCNGTGKLSKWISQWNSIDLIEMNTTMFTEWEPNKEEKKLCVASAVYSEVWNTECNQRKIEEYHAYGLCEFKLNL